MNLSRILLGLVLIIGAGGALATGTAAFFSDTETSEGVFTAGSIDLMIDHLRQTYNDDVCQDGCVETTTNLVVDGGFESPEVTTGDNWDIFDSPAAGWTVEWRSDIPASFPPQTRPEVAHLELHEGVLGSADEGDQYAELDTDWAGPGQPGDGEPASVTIYQAITTVPGTKYMIRYAFAPRPDTGAAENHLEVRWGGVVEDTVGPVAGAGGPIAWQEHSVEVTATTTTTILQFTDLGTANSVGTFLDDVRVFAMDCTTVISNGQCELWDEKDLEDGDVFWSFDDVKPGDRGTNTISLHVYDNDAWACMMTDNVTDDENEVIDPETNAGDTAADGIPNGELSDFLELVLWEDDNNNGLLDGGETQLYQGGFDGVAMQRLPLQATTTAYLGAAWCFGEQAVNEDGTFSCDGTSPTYNIAQTDIMTTDVLFTAVQQRNNPDFQCAPPEEPEEPEEPEITACLNPETEGWADSVVSHDQGRRKNGTFILAARSDASKVLGAAETSGTPTDATPPGSTFYSLGFNVGTTSTRSITVAFDNVVWNQAGADLRIYEVTGGSYPDETARVEASQDGLTWVTLSPDAVRDEDLDLGSLAWAKYVRITDLSPLEPFETLADGFDLDAVQAINCGILND